MKQNIAIEKLALLLRFRKVPGLYLGRHAGYSVSFRDFTQLFYVNAGTLS
jgi:hypothetical protein